MCVVIGPDNAAIIRITAFIEIISPHRRKIFVVPAQKRAVSITLVAIAYTAIGKPAQK
jgi:hypothetical protein